MADTWAKNFPGLDPDEELGGVTLAVTLVTGHLHNVETDKEPSRWLADVRQKGQFTTDNQLFTIPADAIAQVQVVRVKPKKKG